MQIGEAGLRVGLGVAAAALAFSLSTASAGTPAFNPANAARGKTLAGPCATCHFVPDMQAGTPPFHVPKLAGQRPEAIFLALRDYKSGARKSDVMAPIVATLTEQDMRDLGAYLSAGGPHMPTTAGANTWAHKKVHRDCTACHGESGMGVMTGVPVLTGQHADYLMHAMEAYRSGNRSNSTMAPIVAKLSANEVRLLAEYFALQKHLKVSE
jgi:cytochrome c553